MPVPSTPASERVWRFIDRTATCWLWTGFIMPNGYAQFHVTRVDGKKVTAYVHRFVWELTRGPIPQGMEIDHICRVRHCVNPDHLRVVSHRENTLAGVSNSAINARKTHCVHGHRLAGENLYRWRNKRACQTCRRRAKLKKVTVDG